LTVSASIQQLGDKLVFAIEISDLRRSSGFALGGLRYWFSGQAIGCLDSPEVLSAHAARLSNFVSHCDCIERPDLASLSDEALWLRLREYEGAHKLFMEQAFDRYAMYVVYDGLRYRFVWRVLDRQTREYGDAVFGAVVGGKAFEVVTARFDVLVAS